MTMLKPHTPSRANPTDGNIRWSTQLARRIWPLGVLIWASAAAAATPPASQQDAASLTQPEAASAIVAKTGWTTKTYAVAAANPLATDAGHQILRQGGSALDAAIAVQMVLSLVEPQSSGLGGGAFLMHFDGRQTQAFDGRETAPLGVTPQELLQPDGKPMGMSQAIVGGRAVGVPGTLRMLEVAHRQHGRLPWARLFQPAIVLAEQGFVMSPRMATLLASDRHLRKDPVALAYLFDPQGAPWPAGHLLRNPELAQVLQQIARDGADALMRGEIAQAMVQKVQNHPTNPGKLSLQDLSGYRPVVRKPLCFDYAPPAPHRAVVVCGMPAPSSGAIAIGQILGMLAHTPAATLELQQGQPSADWLHLYAEAARQAFADRAQFVADPDFVQPPAGDWNSLLEPEYLASRARAIDSTPEGKSMGTAKPGRPGAARLSYGRSDEQVETGTSHISVVDAYGNGVAMTTTIEDAWGSRQMVNRGVGLVGGFLLNNELTDFNFAPTDAAGLPVANRIEAGKRPRSSMAPTLIFDKATGQLLISTGSPGGALIIHFVAKTLYGMLHWNLNAQEAINLPNFATLGGPLYVEPGRFSSETLQALRLRRHAVMEVDLPSGIQAISRTAEGYFGGADPRREGVVRGD